MKRKTIDKVIKDKNGQVVLTQKPNLPIILFVIFGTIALLFVSHPPLFRLFSILSLLSMFVWSLLEIFSGVNHFRRGLGLIALALTVTASIFLVRFW
jgi:hypothetical protein